MTKGIIFLIWLVLAIGLWDISLEMISASNTAENLMGIILIILLISISITTKCLTKITKLWEKD